MPMKGQRRRGRAIATLERTLQSDGRAVHINDQKALTVAHRERQRIVVPVLCATTGTGG